MKPVVFKQFVKSPRTVGAVLPSSSFLCKTIVSDIGIESADSVVELGPGTGAATPHILNSITPEAKFFAVELDQEMLSVFTRRFPEVKVYNESASSLPQLLQQEGLTQVDAVISGLPWASFPCKLQEDILDAVIESMSPGGVFTTFAYIQGMLLPAAKKFKKRLHKYFSSVEKSRIVWRNVPPAFVYRCRK